MRRGARTRYNIRVNEGGPIRYEVLFYKALRDRDYRAVVSPRGFVEKVLGNYSDIHGRNLTADDFVITHEKGSETVYVETTFLVYVDIDGDYEPSLNEIDDYAQDAGIDFFGERWSYRTEDFTEISYL